MARPTEERLILLEGYGNNWKNLREANKLTVRELAERIGISASTISAIETEARKPTIHHINLYWNYFDVSVDYLTGRTKASSIEYSEVSEFIKLSERAIRNIQWLGKDCNINEVLEDFTFLKMMIDTYQNLKRYYKPINESDDKQGYWIDIPNGNMKRWKEKCSVCGEYTRGKYPYCRNCGSKMGGDANA